MKKLLSVLMVIVLGIMIMGCRSSERASWNLNVQAEEFRLLRRIAAVNGITDEPLFEIVGYCSIETGSSFVEGTMEITCKIKENSITKHFVYLSDNVLIIVEQLEGVDVPQYHYQIVFAPQALLPIPEIIVDEFGD